MKLTQNTTETITYAELLSDTKEVIINLLDEGKRITMDVMQEAIYYAVERIYDYRDALFIATQLNIYYLHTEEIEWSKTLYQACCEIITKSLTKDLLNWYNPALCS